MPIGDVINGTKAILEGFGNNPPTQAVSQARADVCLRGGKDGAPCSYNHTGGFSLTATASQIIHAQRQRKLELKLAVDGEESLGICKLCGCYLKLKVFFDADTIRNHTTDEAFSKFPSFCWIKHLKPHHNDQKD